MHPTSDRVVFLLLVKSLKCYNCEGEDCRTEADCSVIPSVNQGCIKLVTTGTFNRYIHRN